MPSVAIVGAGVSGLAACKAALEEGLEPSVFEQAAELGGAWRQDASGKVWSSLKTNLSKFTCAFSDAPWPDDAPDFPSGERVRDYLQQYAMTNDLLRYITFGVRVTKLELKPGGGWQLSWEPCRNNESSTTAGCATFEKIIVASGIFAEGRIPKIPGLETFSGRVLHSEAYKSPEEFAGSQVLVVGAAFSGADIAAELSRTAKSVTIAARRPLWYVPRYVMGRPADLAFYSRAGAAKSEGKSEAERDRGKHAFLASVIESVGGYPDDVVAPVAERDQAFVALTDEFLPAVRDDKVKVKAAGLVSVSGSEAELSDGSKLNADIIIFATGFKPKVSFFSEQVLEILEYDEEDWLQPLLLHECVWRPELPGLAFAGLYRGPYFSIMELQARWACGVFSGRLPYPSAEEMVAGLEVERRIRSKKPRPQFPHGDYVGMAEVLAKLVGVFPSSIIEDLGHPFRHLIYDGPLLPFHYRLQGFGAKPKVAEEAIRACLQAYPLPSSL